MSACIEIPKLFGVNFTSFLADTHYKAKGTSDVA